MSSEPKRRWLKIGGRVVGSLAAVWVVLSLVAVFVMTRPYDQMGRMMDKVPGPFWMILPMKLIWTHANAGDIEPGDLAPDFELGTLDGQSKVRLSSLRGRPVVLLFGSYTCPPFRRVMPGINELYEPFRDRADFYFIYIEEAHPTDQWKSGTNAREGILYASHQSLADRIEVGEVCQDKLKMPFKMLVDDMDNAVGRRYRGWPTRAYIVDKDGKVAFKTIPGPFGFEADLIRPALERIVGPPAPAAPARAAVPAAAQS